MKANWKKMLVMAAAAALLLTGCSDPKPPAGSAAPEGSAGPESSASGEASAPAESGSVSPGEPDKSEARPQKTGLIREIISEDGTFKSNGAKYDYSFHVPQLNLKSAAAGEINRDIDSRFGEEVRQARKQMKNKEDPPISGVSWRCYENGDVVSLVVKLDRMVMVTDYEVYNYNREKDIWYMGFEVLDDAGVDRDSFQRGALRAAAAEFDLGAVKMPGAMDYYSGLAQLRADTLGFANLSAMKVYLGKGGQPYIVMCIGSPAGAGYYNTVLKVDMKTDHSSDQKLRYEFITAELKDGAVTLTFLNVPPAEHYVGSRVKYGVPYEVKGLYGRYTDLFIGSMGQDLSPCLFLADENGYVTYCDIMAGIGAGCSFTAVGPLPEPADVVSFDQRPVDGVAQTVYAHNKSGRDVDMSGYVETLRKLASDSLEYTRWFTGDEKYAMSFQLDGEVLVQVTEPATGNMPYVGRGEYLGLDESGLHYSLTLQETNPQYASQEEYEEKGFRQLEMVVEGGILNGAGAIPNIYLTEVGGQGLWGHPSGEPFPLTGSYD